MLIQEQLDILRQGASVWNTWRQQQPTKSIDFSNIFLRGANLSNVDLKCVDLSNADLRCADLSNANLREANLRGADLSRADLSNTDLSNTNLNNVDLSSAYLRDANLTRADLCYADLSNADLCYACLRRANLSNTEFNNTNLSNANLSNVNFSGAGLDNVNLSRADLSGVNLSYVDFSSIDLSGVYLGEVNLSNADLSNADLSNANLNRANLRRADLSHSDLSEANLSHADLSHADLSETNFNRTNLREANLSEAILGRTIFNDIDLRTVKGLETVKHRTYSAFATSTIARSQGDIPEVFLRGVGVDDILIKNIRPLYAVKQVDYYTCFISYSSKDELFARRLHNDLQQEGIRCWFAPEDMDIGDKIKLRIDESIRMYDKLLLILSEHSIKSSWVAYEVEKALSKEPQGTSNVLYPVRVDQTILTCTESWAQEIKETRHIGNFEHWTSPVQYEKSFKGLLRALNTNKVPEKSQRQIRPLPTSFSNLLLTYEP